MIIHHLMEKHQSETVPLGNGLEAGSMLPLFTDHESTTLEIPGNHTQLITPTPSENEVT